MLARNAYNTYFIECELGEGCEIYLNVHGTLKDNGELHYWLDKIARRGQPFAFDVDKVILSQMDTAFMFTYAIGTFIS